MLFFPTAPIKRSLRPVSRWLMLRLRRFPPCKGRRHRKIQGFQAAHLLNSAWSALNVLKGQAAAAVASGDAALARQLATQAAGVAGSIRVVIDSASASASAGSQMVLDAADAVDAVALSTSTATSSSSVSAGGGGSSAGATSQQSVSVSSSSGDSDPFSVARASLGVAKSVVDMAQSLPQTSADSWETLTNLQKDIQEVMVQVERAAESTSSSSVQISSYGAHSFVDISA